jgi:hypothetical protein
MMEREIRLASPGAGVPVWQRLAGKYLLLPAYVARLSWDGACDLFVREGRQLLDASRGLEESRMKRRVLVPPQIGLEDSSRHWSYAMVLEHLTIMGNLATDVVLGLGRGRVAAPPLSTADLKPRGDGSASEAKGAYREFLSRFERAVRDEMSDRSSPARWSHPWFGPLTARQWVCFMPMHQRIHIRQARRILAA